MAYAVFLFATTHDTIKAERLAVRAGVSAEVIPQPPGTKGRCGVALRIPTAAMTRLKGIFADEGLADFETEER